MKEISVKCGKRHPWLRTHEFLVFAELGCPGQGLFRGQRIISDYISLPSKAFSRYLHYENLPTVPLCKPTLNILFCALGNSFRPIFHSLSRLCQAKKMLSLSRKSGESYNESHLQCSVEQNRK